MKKMCRHQQLLVIVLVIKIAHTKSLLPPNRFIEQSVRHNNNNNNKMDTTIDQINILDIIIFNLLLMHLLINFLLES